MELGVLSTGALSTFLRLTSEGEVGVKEGWRVEGKEDNDGGGGGDKKGSWKAGVKEGC